MTVLRSIASRLSLVVIGLLAGLLLLEVVLQTAALGRRLLTAARSAESPGGTRRILALGDSNTYGLYLDAAEAWPAILEQRWNAAHPGKPVEVVNFGFPGTNSTMLRHALPRLIARTRPAVVTILVGANDFWTEPATGDAEADAESVLWRWSRVYRVLYMLRQWRLLREGDPRMTYEPQPGYKEGGGAVVVGGRLFELNWHRRTAPDREWVGVLRENLEEMVVWTRQAGAEPVLLTYPATDDPLYVSVSDIVRHAAKVVAARVIDLGALFPARCRSGDCPELFFADHHPTAKGHALAAETLLAQWNGWGDPAASPRR